jgi:hypothetical protein
MVLVLQRTQVSQQHASIFVPQAESFPGHVFGSGGVSCLWHRSMKSDFLSMLC